VGGMPGIELAALAQSAGQTVAAAAMTDMWESVRGRFARLVGRRDARKAQAAEQRLEQTRQQLAAAPPGSALEQAQKAAAQQWAILFEDLLDDHPDAGAELLALVTDVAARLPATAAAAHHPVAAGRDVTVAAAGAIAAALLSGNVVSRPATTWLDHPGGFHSARDGGTGGTTDHHDSHGHGTDDHDGTCPMPGERARDFGDGSGDDQQLDDAQHEGLDVEDDERDSASHSGAALGASIGTVAGPVGAVIGGALGALLGRTLKRRYLRGQCPETAPVGEPFSLIAAVVLDGSTGAALKPFAVPPAGQDVLLVVHAPGVRLLGRQRMTVHVPSGGDSEPVMFELCTDMPGPRRISVTAWLSGSYLGELVVEVTAERGGRPGPQRDVRAAIASEAPSQGAVSLVVRYDPVQNAYRFEFRDEDNPDEVTSHLAYEPGPLVEQLVGGLEGLAKGRSGYSAAQTRDYLINAGAALWQQLVPVRLREQFWERQHRIRQLTILADKDTVPWELLYPLDPGYDAGFLVEQFPVTRAVFGRRPARLLNLSPARFVLPASSPPEAAAEIEAMRRLLDPGQSPDAVISALTPLLEVIRGGDFGLLHFACHNRFDPADGSSITMDKRQFTPTLLTTAAIGKVLTRSAPVVFVNACRSGGHNPSYNQLDGWASKFLEAGAAAFIGSLWAVSDGAAREFAGELYGRLQAGSSLGEAIMSARQAAAGQPGDPTWLAYTVYGDPRAVITRSRP
jgi:CHAT domain